MLAALQQKKAVVFSPRAVVNNASYTCNIIDTFGFDYAQFVFQLGATDIALTAFKLQESDDSGMSGAADVAGTIFGTDKNDTGNTSTLPSATDDDKVFEMAVNLRPRKRYLRPVVTVGSGSTGAYMNGLVILSRGFEGPRTAAQSGLSQRMIP